MLFVFKQKTAYERPISDWSSDVCSSDLMNILLVEDDDRISRFLARGLKAEGYSVDVAATGPEGLELAFGEHLSLIILDVMLPGLSGREVCRQLRDAAVHTPVLMLTALDSIDDRVNGLRTGADDYLTKP